jgi:magnesium-transporting ATPase (P-type)
MVLNRLASGSSSPELLAAYLWLTLIGVVVLIGMYFTTLLHTCAGSKYKFVINLLVMLILSNIATMFVVYTNWKLFYVQDQKEGFVWLLAVAVGVQDVMFNVSHFVLAQKYREISNKVPQLL